MDAHMMQDVRFFAAWAAAMVLACIVGALLALTGF
jgi:hypothetical protein